MSTSTGSKEFDLVLQGATGFTGRLAAGELALHAPAGLRWAVAGRDAAKLGVLSKALGVPFVVADGLDAEAVGQLAHRARVVLSCAGPFTRFGTLLVDACVAHGTHYADLTGEVPWVVVRPGLSPQLHRLGSHFFPQGRGGPPVPRAARSHSRSVGRRLPIQLA